MVDEIPLDTRDVRLEVTVPCDDRFRPVLNVLCERMARYVGYSEADAAEVAGSVAQATDGVIAHAASPEYLNLGVTILTSERDIEFRVRYLRGDQPLSDETPSLEQRLGEPRGDKVPLDVVRRVMRRVEFGHDDGVEFCVLSKALPEEQ